MWIPKPIYDHAPLFWLLLGSLFLAGGIYLNFSDGLQATYFVFAVFCFGHAAWTFFARRRHRQRAEARLLDENAEAAEGIES